MAKLFAPADAIIGRLSYTYKIALTAILFIVPVSYLIWLDFSHTEGQIRQLRSEQSGLEYLQAARQVFKLVPQHRGLSQGILNGKDGLRPKLKQVEQGLDTALKALAGVDSRLGAQLHTGDQVASLTTAIRSLVANGLQLEAAQSFEQHSAAIIGLYRLITYVSNESGLSIDPDLAAALSARHERGHADGRRIRRSHTRTRHRHRRQEGLHPGQLHQARFQRRFPGRIPQGAAIQVRSHPQEAPATARGPGQRTTGGTVITGGIRRVRQNPAARTGQHRRRAGQGIR